MEKETKKARLTDSLTTSAHELHLIFLTGGSRKNFSHVWFTSEDMAVTFPFLSPADKRSKRRRAGKEM